MRLVFMGTPEFAIPSLDVLADQGDILTVVTQPDRPAGRGRSLRSSPVKGRALELGLPVLEPVRLKAQAVVEELQTMRPDLIVVAAYGQILPRVVLEIPPHGCLNVHASLLPRWRGAAPIQAAILHGDGSSGTTIMRMDEGLDTGPILAQRSTPIGTEETGGELGVRLAVLGAELLGDSLPEYLSGRLLPGAQDDAQATYAPALKKSNGALDPRRSAEQLARQVRAFEPWPGSFLQWEGGRLLVRRAHSLAAAGHQPGTLTAADDFPALATQQGILVLDLVQPPGRKSMPGSAFLRGAPEFLQSAVLAPSPT